MDKMKMHTVDVTDENIKKIGELFPNCVTERLDVNGKPERAIDFDILRHELSKNIVEGPQERYQFTWPDKKKAIRLANTPSNMTLRPCREESVDFDVERVKGAKNILFGEGLFFSKLTGPGKVWIQTMPISKLAEAIIPFIPKSNDSDFDW